MNRADIDAFLAERRNAVLATVDQRGQPVQVPLWFDWRDGALFISVTSERTFFANLRRSPLVSVCIDDAGRPVRTVLIRGRCRVIEGEEHWQHTERIVAKYLEPAQRQATLERMHREPRVILEITPSMITSWSPTPADREVWREADPAPRS